MIFIELYETWWCMWVYLEWQLNCNEELYIKGNKCLKCYWILSYHLLVQELSRESCEHPVTLIHPAGTELISDWFIHPAGRARTSDWSVNSFMMVVIENFSVLLWTELPPTTVVAGRSQACVILFTWGAGSVWCQNTVWLPGPMFLWEVSVQEYLCPGVYL